LEDEFRIEVKEGFRFDSKVGKKFFSSI